MRFLLPVFACLLAVQASLIPKYRAEKCSRNARPRPQPRGVLERKLSKPATSIAPKIFIISMFDSEADVWYENMPSLYDKNITIPGASPLFRDAHCTKAGDVCQLTTGEGEINAASSMSALLFSPAFNLKKTYFLVAGIAGINPHWATTGSVTFAHYAVQLDLQEEFSFNQVPSNDSSGYYPQDGYYPDSPLASDYPTEYGIYGTEVFELNIALVDKFAALASAPKLNDTKAAAAYRATYPYAPANQPPSVVICSTGTSNVYWSGSTLGEAFYNYTLLMTNGSAHYCATQQEDNAHMEVFLRGDLAGLVDYARVAIMRTASDFDRAPPGETEVYHLLYANQEGFGPSIENIWIAGEAIVKDVLGKWSGTYEGGVKAKNYLGDLWNSLDSKVKPDIG
jgi:purine nucleoside permease